MNLGKLVRLNRLFAHPSGRLCSIAVDHFIGYGLGLPAGLRHVASTLAAIVAAEPDAVTLHKGLATGFWAPYAGRLPLIVQSSLAHEDDAAFEQIVTPEEAVRLGADAIAVVVWVRGASEAPHLRVLADCVCQAARFELPVICHIYPRDYSGQVVRISHAPEDVAWAVRCAVECGADVVKAPYCGDVQAHSQIVVDCPVPLVVAGGPQTSNLEQALGMMADAVRSGARGATIGRNVWGLPQISEAVQAFKAVIHDDATPADALRLAGL